MKTKILAAASLVLLLSPPASATPVVDITAAWSLYPVDAMPPGLEISCTGDAIQSGSACYVRSVLHSEVPPASGATVSLEQSARGGITVTNNGGPLTGLLRFVVDYSAFNPGGAQEGIIIDDPHTQAARFTSTVGLVDEDIPGLVEIAGGVFDHHACAVGFLGEDGVLFGATACGVPLPDSSQTDIYLWLDDLAPGSSVSLALYDSTLCEFAFAVPEPSSLAITIPGIMSLFALGLPAWRRRWWS